MLGCLAALRDDASTAHRLIGQARAIAVRLNPPLLHATVRMARGTALSCSGDHAQAYAQLRRLIDPADAGHHVMTALWTVGDLAEAAAHCGEKDDAQGVLDRFAPLARRTPAARVRLAARHARAVLAGEEEGEAAFAAALGADLTGWSLERARLRLAYGEWLRRQRRVLESRAPLRAARDTFDDLEAAAWSRRARQELEATGETTRQRSPRAADRLTSPRIGQHGTAGSALLHGPVAPVHPVADPPHPPRRSGRALRRPGRPRLEEQHPGPPVLREPRGEHAPRGPATDDDVVVCRHPRPPSRPVRGRPAPGRGHSKN